MISLSACAAAQLGLVKMQVLPKTCIICEKKDTLQLNQAKLCHAERVFHFRQTWL